MYLSVIKHAKWTLSIDCVSMCFHGTIIEPNGGFSSKPCLITGKYRGRDLYSCQLNQPLEQSTSKSWQVNNRFQWVFYRNLPKYAVLMARKHQHPQGLARRWVSHVLTAMFNSVIWWKERGRVNNIHKWYLKINISCKTMPIIYVHGTFSKVSISRKWLSSLGSARRFAPCASTYQDQHHV